MLFEPVVGKNILETLTVGMYTDPRIVYREYIQNAADAIDVAEKQGYYGDMFKPLIGISVTGRTITIEDNGTGIRKDEALPKLGDIGKSEKDYKEQRGFRGIGRLGGLAYCAKLTFVTSAAGEDEYTKVSFDCNRLKQLMMPNVVKDMSAVALMKEITSFEYGKEDKNKRYTKVIMENVRERQLLEEKDIYEFLCQIAPVRYHSTKFVFAKKIYETFEKNGLKYENYDVKFNGRDVLKPYTGHIKVHGQKTDFIRNVNIIEHVTEDGKNSFLAWYGESHMLGAIVDHLQRGMRIRKGNIQIGDDGFSRIFLSNTNERFHTYVQGEAFVFDDGMIPNARRDSFEASKNFDAFKASMKNIFEKIIKDIREKSRERNNPRVRMMNKVEEIVEDTTKKIENGFKTKKELEKTKEEVSIAKDLVNELGEKTEGKKIPVKTAEIENKIIQLRQKVDTAFQRLEADSYFKADKITTKLSRKEKKIVIEIFDVIYEQLEKDKANDLIDLIIERLNRRRKEEIGG